MKNRIKKNISYKKKNKRRIKGGNIFKESSTLLPTYLKNSINKGKNDFMNGKSENNETNENNQKMKLQKTLESIPYMDSLIHKGNESFAKQVITQDKDPEKTISDIQNSLSSLDKPPIMHVIDYLLYTLYTIAGIFIYYPTFLVNLPDTTLEKIVPTEEGCKTLIGDELMCKKKLKCFFKKCTMFEDPIGYKLQKEIDQSKKHGIHRFKSKKVQKIKMNGGNKMRTMKQKEHKYLKFIPYKVKKQMKKAQKRELKLFLKLYKSLIQTNKKGGGSQFKMAKGAANIAKNIAGTMRVSGDNIEQNTCINKVTHEDGTTTTSNILCDAKKSIDYKSDEPNNNVLYKALFGRNQVERMKETVQKSKEQLKTIFSMGKSVRNLSKKNGTLNEKISQYYLDNGIEPYVETEMVEEFLKDYMDHDSIYKMLLAYKMLDTIFKNEINEYEMEKYNEDIPDEMYGIDVAFPWSTKSHFATPEERRKCLFAHLTKSNLGDEYKSSDLYEKCFICKNCTLANTSFKAWDKVFSNLFVSSKTQFSNISSDLFQIMKKNYRFHLLPAKQYYLISLLALYFVHPMIDLKSLNMKIRNEDGEYYDIRDIILGIPNMSSVMEPSPMIKEQLRETYMIMKMMNVEEILYSMTFKIMYRNILKETNMNIEKRLHEIKKEIKKKYDTFYGRSRLYGLLDNNVDFYELENFNPAKASQKIRNIQTNMDVYGDEEISDSLNDHFKLYLPLFQLLLNKNTYDNESLYETSENEYVRKFQSIVMKINEIERNELKEGD